MLNLSHKPIKLALYARFNTIIGTDFESTEHQNDSAKKIFF